MAAASFAFLLASRVGAPCSLSPCTGRGSLAGCCVAAGFPQLPACCTEAVASQRLGWVWFSLLSLQVPAFAFGVKINHLHKAFSSAELSAEPAPPCSLPKGV